MNRRPGWWRLRSGAAAVLAAWLAVLIASAGCSADPAEPPTTTIITAQSSISSTAANTPAGPLASSPARAGEPSTVTNGSSTVISPEPASTTAAGTAGGSFAAAEPESTAAQPPPPTAGFVSTIGEIDPAIASRMGTSWHEGCPVPLADLRYLTVIYRGFDGADHSGELVVAAAVAADVTDVFRQLYESGFPIASLRLVDDFGGSDDASMAADNSSAFNCRPVTGGGGFSEHSYGTAIDLNPVQNPYLSGSLVLPPSGQSYLDRHPAPGVIEPGDAVVTAFASHGWTWGGTWRGPIDYQHFSVSGR